MLRRLAFAISLLLMVATFLTVLPTGVSSATGSAAVTAPAQPTFALNTSGQDPGDFVISGFGASDTLLVSVGFVNPPAGVAFSLPTTTGLTASFGYNFTGGKTQISFTGTMANANAALAAMTVATGSSSGDITIRVTASSNKANVYYNPINGHFYEYVARANTMAYAPADTANSAVHLSETRTLFGVRGYLATITSAQEQAFIFANVNASNIWLGGSDGVEPLNERVGTFANQSAAEGKWYWVTGPEAGTQFWNGNTSGSWIRASDGAVISAISANVSSARYENWCDGNAGGSPNTALPDSDFGLKASGTAPRGGRGEPNGTGTTPTTGEQYLLEKWSGAPCWNDWGQTASGVQSGFLVEYSENWGSGAAGSWNAPRGTFATSGSDLIASNSITARVDNAPRNVTASEPSSSAMTVSWSAPLTGTVSSYTVTSSPGGLTCSTSSTSCTITGLNAGTSYTFVVRATFSDASTRDSLASSAVSTLALSQAVDWSLPASQSSLVLAESGITLAAASTNGDGAITYSVVSQGQTGCAINSSRVITFGGTGTCVLRASAAGTATYLADSEDVTITIAQGTFAISSNAGVADMVSNTFRDVCESTCDISGFAPSDSILVVVSSSSGSALLGRVRLGSDVGLGDVTGYATDPTNANGYAEIAFTGTLAQVNTALETLQYKGPAAGGEETIGISASLSGAAYFAGTGHYYQFVSSTVSWTTALTNAGNQTFNGLSGYLATVTSQAENDFITSKVGTATAWLAGSDRNLEGTWKWEAGPEVGTTFWTGTGTSGFGHNTASPFTYWGSSEPNQAGDEDCLEIVSGGSGRWNDIPCSQSKGYVIEFGSGGGTVLKQASTTFRVASPTAPLQVTALTATPGDGQITLSWTAPGSGGSAITDYVIEQSFNSGVSWTTIVDGVSSSASYTVTGLTNGTSYQFRVSAKNDVGTGTVSSAVTGIPAVPPSSSSPTVVRPPLTQPVQPPRIIGPVQPVIPPAISNAPVIQPGQRFDPNQGTRATIGGQPATVSQRPSPDNNGLSVQAGTLSLGMNLAGPVPGGGVQNNTSTNSPELRVPVGQTTTVAGGGLLPGSTLQVWLPGSGTSPRELGRIPVRPDGTFESQVTFASNLSEAPLPIGRQVLQVAGFDERGNQTVVNMTINVAQGPPAPEFNRANGALPDLSPGQSLATSAGDPTSVIVTPFSENGNLLVDGGDWAINIAIDTNNGTVGGTPEEPIVQMAQSSTGSVSGDGLMPDTEASIWLFSDPTLMGSVKVAADGSFEAEFLVDATFIAAGEHTLQIQGVGEDGYIKAINLGVLIEESVETTPESASSMLWWIIAAGVLVVALIIGGTVAVRRRRLV